MSAPEPESLLRDTDRARRKYRRLLGACRKRAPALFLAVRRRLGLSQARMADLLAISPVWLCKIERGRKPPGPALLTALCWVSRGYRLGALKEADR